MIRKNDNFNKQEVIAAYNVLRDRKEVLEARIFGTKWGTVSGYFDDPGRLAEAIRGYNDEYSIYVTLNPVNPALKARSSNRLKTYAKNTTSDRDIIKRTWLPIDIDPIRPSGISATDEELEAALKVAEDIKQYLTKLGWGGPIKAISGNGAHLLYKIDLPNDEASKELIKNVLRTLDWKYSNEKVNVDVSPHNAARIWKLYGTLACKGDNTEKRPHRKAKILNTPEELMLVAEEKLKQLIKELPVVLDNNKFQKKAAIAADAGNFGLEKWIEEHKLDVVKSGRWNGQAKRYILKTCPWNEDHTDSSAYIIKFDNGGIAAGCHHNSCSNENWYSLRAKFDPDYKDKKNTSSGEEAKGEKRKQADVLLELVGDIELFTDDLEEAYGVLEISSHQEIWPIDSSRFEHWLIHQYYKEMMSSPSREAIKQAKEIMKAMALFEGKKRKLYRRVAKVDDSFYYDLVNSEWQAVEISTEGVSIVDRPPIVFNRNKNMNTQVKPDFNGNFNKILDHISLEDADDCLLYKVYLISCLVPEIPHPILVVHGEKGSSKSTFIKMTRSIVDPAKQDLLTMPKSKRDLVITLRNNYLSSFDNMETLSKEKSNLLCMASTGGAFSTRKLYSNSEEMIIEFKRCLALNGINLVTTEPDIVDRSLIFELSRIGRGKYKEEKKLWNDFNEDKPAIIGGALTTLSKAMEIYPGVEVDRLGRMADFTKWGFAISEALGVSGERFLEVYFKNQETSNEEIIQSHPLASAVIKMMESTHEKIGLVSTILDSLEKTAQFHNIDTNSYLWPGSASALSRRLREVKSNLEDVGIYYSKQKKSRGKILTIVNENVDVTSSSFFNNQGKKSSLEEYFNL